MSNPFQATFDSTCDSCGDDIIENEWCVADDGSFICEGCAEDQGKLCECGNYKKPNFELCYECKKSDKMEKRD